MSEYLLDGRLFTPNLSIPSLSTWHAALVLSMILWVALAKNLKIVNRIRNAYHLSAKNKVYEEVPSILQMQKRRTWWLDLFFLFLTNTVSIEFYTAFLPLLFWADLEILARQVTILLGICIFAAAAVKDIVCSPRPPCPPVWQPASEKHFTTEYGFPSSHTINCVALSVHLLVHFARESMPETSPALFIFMSSILLLLSLSVGISRVYLGMHSFLDVKFGFAMGILLSLAWSLVDRQLDSIILSDQRVDVLQLCISVFLTMAYPVPMAPSSSFSDATAFNGVILGVVLGSSRLNLSPMVERGLLSSDFPPGALRLVCRTAVGLPLALFAKFVGRRGAVFAVSVLHRLHLLSFVGIKLRSTKYVEALLVKESSHASIDAPTVSSDKNNSSDGNLRKRHMHDSKDCDKGPMGSAFVPASGYDVDVGIRLFEYAMLGWAVVELAPYVFVVLRF